MRPVDDLQPLGESDIKVGPLGFGGVPIANLYSSIPVKEALDTVDAAYDTGLRYFDTAPLYGFGLGERRLGVALGDKPREAHVISTKIGRTLSPSLKDIDHSIFENAPPFDAAFDFSYDGVMRQFEDSLQRLGVARLDAIVIHDIGLWHMETQEAVEHHFRTFVDGGLKALEELKEQGVLGAIGAGANELTLCKRFLDLDPLDFVLLALRYTLLDQSSYPDVLDRASERKKSIVVGAPFQSGILATGARSGAKVNYGDADAETIDRVQTIEQIAKTHNVGLRALALQFPLTHPACVSVLAGMRTRQEVTENVAAAQEAVPAQVWSDLREAAILSQNWEIKT